MDADAEIWKPIEGYEGLYQISTFGHVKSLERTMKNHGVQQRVPERILKPGIASNGYYTVALNKNGKHRTFCIHSLVANAFVSGKTEEKCVVNHKDENKTNNHYLNLEWCTFEYNITYGDAKQKRKNSLIARKTWNKPPRAVQLVVDGFVSSTYESLNEAARRTGVSVYKIFNECSGRKKNMGNNHWQYAN